MAESNHGKFVSAVFITFSGNCRNALTHYQTCFGGSLQFDTFEQELQGYTAMPVVMGSLVADSVIIHGSDLVHSEGRTLGNYISIFLPCRNVSDRQALIGKLKFNKENLVKNYDDQKLVEVTDVFDVRWILSI